MITLSYPWFSMECNYLHRPFEPRHWCICISLGFLLWAISILLIRHLLVNSRIISQARDQSLWFSTISAFERHLSRTEAVKCHSDMNIFTRNFVGSRLTLRHTIGY